ncbi:MAG: hypothetical protein KAJ10_01630 [Thermodesulfovibrionia bacterium]|nr:hypothetical protein [Thermodesulfovibrionia bacterium]
MIAKKYKTGMSKKIIILSLVFFLFVFSVSVCATETNIIENDEVIVQYERPLRTAAKHVMEIYPAVRAELEKTFEWKIDFRPKVVLVKDLKTFKGMGGSDLIVAFAISKGNVIVIDNSKMKTHPFTMEVTLKHELCHLFLHNYIRGGNLPRWLNEGISQWVSGAITEIIIGENKDLLKQATLSGRFIRINDLTERFPQDEKSLQLAYQESRSFVDYIYGEFGSGGILRILDLLRDGNKIDAAILESVSIPVDELENRWHDRLRKKFTWFTYLSNHLYQILFSLSAVILIYGFIRLLIRKKAYKDNGEDDEIDRDFPD